MASWKGTVSMHRGDGGPALGTSQEFAFEAADRGAAEAKLRELWTAASKPIAWADLGSAALRDLTPSLDVNEA